MIHDYLHHLDSNFVAPDSLEQYATRVKKSPAHFRRVFRNQFGKPPHQYLKQTRLQWAALNLLLNQSDMTAIAKDCGFNTAASFSKGFKQHFGVAPSLFLKDREVRIKTKLEQMPLNYSPEVKIELREAIPIAAMRHTLENDQDAHGYERAWRLFLFKAGRQLIRMRNFSLFDLSYDDTFLMEGENCRFDTAMSLPEGFSVPKSIGVKEIPAGLYATLQVQGSIQEIDLAWHWFLFKWLRNSNHSLSRFLGVTQVEIPGHLSAKLSLMVDLFLNRTQATLLLPIRESD